MLLPIPHCRSKLFPTEVPTLSITMLSSNIPTKFSYYMPPGNQTYHPQNPISSSASSLITQPYYLHLALTTIALTPPIAVIPQNKHSTCISGTTISPILTAYHYPHYKPNKPKKLPTPKLLVCRSYNMGRNLQRTSTETANVANNTVHCIDNHPSGNYARKETT